MITKKQHYYPRGLLKHFANDRDMVHTFIVQTNKIREMNYSNVCMKHYAYESRDIVDNILERLLGNYESKAVQ
ncbi:hypothetical protein H700_11961 [Staphylococcus epidermidis 41tr]|nr:hypothetical protein H700_11961 [Staphylococcus epidermidis 41tr]